jgi:hypothetical protein
MITIAMAMGTVGLCAQTWNRLSGLGISGGGQIVTTLHVEDTILYVAGGFNQVDTMSVNNCVFYDGTAWHKMAGTGVVDGIYNVDAIIVYQNTVYAGGGFQNVGWNNQADCFAKWTGVDWTDVGAGPIGIIAQSPYDMKVYKGELYLIGNLYHFYGSPDLYISRWNGSQMLGVGGGLDGGTTMGRVLEVYDGMLIAGGTFGYAGGVYSPCVAAWDGNAWHALGDGLNNYAYSLEADTINNVLYVGGGFTAAGGVPANFIAKWDGENWYPVGVGFDADASGLCMYRNQIYASGPFEHSGIAPVRYLARFNGQVWDTLGTPPNNGLSRAIAAYQDELYVGGGFSTIGDSAIQSLARWHYPADSACKDLSVAIAPFPDTLHTSQLPYKFRSHSYSNNYCAWSFSDGHTANTGHAPWDFNMTPGTYTVSLEVGCTTDTLTAQQQVVIVSDVGINEPGMLEFVVFPNPSTGDIRIRLAGAPESGLRVELYSTDGKKVLEQAVGGQEFTLPVNGLARGTYSCLLLKAGKRVGGEKVVLD